MMEPLLQVDHLFAAGKFDDAAAAAAKESHRSSNIQSAEVSKLLSRRSEVPSNDSMLYFLATTRQFRATSPVTNLASAVVTLIPVPTPS